MGGSGEGAARQTDDEQEVEGGAGESRGVENEARNHRVVYVAKAARFAHDEKLIHSLLVPTAFEHDSCLLCARKVATRFSPNISEKASG